MYVNAIRALIVCLVLLFIGLAGAIFISSLLTIDTISHDGDGGKKRAVSVYDYER